MRFSLVVLFALTAMVLALFVPALVGLAWAPPCASCHQASGARAVMSDKAHAKVSCDSCHGGTKYRDKVALRQRVWYQMTLHLLPASDGTSNGVDNGRCLQCHDSVTRKPLTSNALIIKHETCAAGADCASCHGGVGHRNGRDGTSAMTYTMDACLKCHLQKRYFEKSDCTVCHSGEVPERDVDTGSLFSLTHGPNWQQSHGMGDQSICRACHSPTFCEPCHGEGVPHDDRFLRSHGALAVGGNAQCFTCHKDKKACDNCHQTEMPHPKTFIKAHSERVQAGGESPCLNCHDKADCVNCHVGHVHPGGTGLD